MLPEPSYVSDAQPPSFFFTPQAPSPVSPLPRQPHLQTIEATKPPCRRPLSLEQSVASLRSTSPPVLFVHARVAQPHPLLSRCLTDPMVMPLPSPINLPPMIINTSPKPAPPPLDPPAKHFDQATCVPLTLRLGSLFTFSPSPVRESLTALYPQP